VQYFVARFKEGEMSVVAMVPWFASFFVSIAFGVGCSKPPDTDTNQQSESLW